MANPELKSDLKFEKIDYEKQIQQESGDVE